jgi:hypothetical protein
MEGATMSRELSRKLSDRKFRSESIDRMEEVFAHTDERVLMAQKVLMTQIVSEDIRTAADHHFGSGVKPRMFVRPRFLQRIFELRRHTMPAFCYNAGVQGDAREGSQLPEAGQGMRITLGWSCCRCHLPACRWCSKPRSWGVSRTCTVASMLQCNAQPCCAAW